MRERKEQNDAKRKGEEGDLKKKYTKPGILHDEIFDNYSLKCVQPGVGCTTVGWPSSTT